MRKINTKINANGDRAYLPHPLFQSNIFAVSDSWQLESEAAEHRKWTFRHINRWGDTVTVKSCTPLTPAGHMGIFLSVISLFLKHCEHKEPQTYTSDIQAERRQPSYAAEIPVSELYDKLGEGYSRLNKRKSWQRIETALTALATMTISVRYAQEQVQKHGGSLGFDLDGLFAWHREIRHGRSGSILHISLCDALMPYNEKPLYASAKICNVLRSETARTLFWNLTCSRHITATIDQYHAMTASVAGNIQKWKTEQFKPALEQLTSQGYYVRWDDKNTVTLKTPDCARLDAKIQHERVNIKIAAAVKQTSRRHLTR